MSVTLAPCLNLGSSSGGSGRGRGSLSSLGGRGSSRGSGSRSSLSGGDVLLLTVGSITLVLLLVGLIGAINSNLDSDLTALNLLSVHLSDSLLLKLLRSQSDETEATTLASLTTSLKLLDHESGNRSKSNLGRRGLISLEKLNELLKN
jgi:hypothetical protein